MARALRELRRPCSCLGMLLLWHAASSCMVLPRHAPSPSMLQTMEIYVRIRIGIPTYTCEYVHVKKYTCVIVHTRTNVHHMQKRTNTPGCATCQLANACRRQTVQRYMQRGKAMRIKEYPYWPCIVHARSDSNNKQISAEVTVRAGARTRHAHARAQHDTQCYTYHQRLAHAF